MSDITATGATFTLPGTLDITTAGIDPASGLVPLPTNLVDASSLIAQGCSADRGNSFVITGRRGLPSTPDQELDDAVEWHDRNILTVAQQIHRDRSARTQPSNLNTEGSHPRVGPQVSTTAPAMIEVTGWQKIPAGDVMLVADTPKPTGQN